MYLKIPGPKLDFNVSGAHRGRGDCLWPEHARASARGQVLLAGLLRGDEAVRLWPAKGQLEDVNAVQNAV